MGQGTLKMSEYDKLWIEVDVDQDRGKKTDKVCAVIEALRKASCVANVTKVQYKVSKEEQE